MTPKFSAFPFDRLPRIAREQAVRESIVARWIAARGAGRRLAKLLARGRDAIVRATIVDAGAFDPFAASCVVRVGSAGFEVRGASLAVRRIAQRLVAGVDELAAPRPLSLV